MRGPRLARALAAPILLAAAPAAHAQGISLDATPAPSPSATATPGSPGSEPGPPSSFEAGQPGQWGYPGALRVVAASPMIAGQTQIAAGIEWFSEPGFIVEGTNHRRTLNTIAVDHALSERLAVSAVVLNMTNHSGATNPLYIAALGDVDLSARLAAPFAGGDTMRLSAGVRGGVKLMQGDGAGKAVGDAASPYVRGLLTLETGPLRIAADAGYLHDRSAALVPEDLAPDAGQLYAYGVSDYDAVLAGLSLDIPAWRISPFAEVSSRVDLGAEGDPATVFTAGLKIASASRRASLLAGFDHGLAGTEVVEGRLRVPTWNVVGGFSYAFGSGGRPPRPRRPRIVTATEDGAPTARLKGTILQMATRAPIPGARVSFDGGPTVTTDQSGAFEADGLGIGTVRITVEADGFQDRRSTVHLAEAKVYAVELPLFPAPVADPVPAPALAPAFVKGRVVSNRGRPLAATVSATSGGRTFETKTDAKGAYEFELTEGAYSLEITAPRMKPQSHSGTLKPNESFELDFMLSPVKKARKSKKKSTSARKTKPR